MFSRVAQSAVLKLAGVLTVSPFQSLFQPFLHNVSPSENVNSFITRETPIAAAGILANIGPHGSKSRGAHAGVVIASPNTHSPNYVYTWIRDSSLVYKVLIDEYVAGTDANLPGINEWIASQSRLQQVSNPSGSITTGGLGEPKFEIDETAFKDGWGRPQRDGPALRSTSMITFANSLIAIGNKTYVQEKIWPIVQLDLDYTASFWNRTGFDLWEEVLGASFFTTAVQHRALREGTAFAKALGQNDLAETYEEQADNALCFLQSYWNPTDSYITANALVVGPSRPTGLDANTVLGSIHTFDPEAGCDSATFQPCSDKALANLHAFVSSFRGDLYPINSGVPSNEAVALGRYASDVYSGDEHDPHANPWYLCTLSVAEQLYDALYTWYKFGSLEVTSLSLPFFKNIVPQATTGTFDSDSVAFKNITAAVKQYADGFVGVVARFTPADGGLAEQFRRDNGKPQSALDLTWSYASALTAFAARGHWWEPESWGAKDSKVPNVCKPNVGPSVEVKFSVEAYTQWGENIFVTGNADALGNWDPNDAVALIPTNYPIWTGTVHVPGDTLFDYKYIRKTSQNPEWEPRGDRRVKAPATGSGDFNDVWGR